jgi:hypothetical protein
MRALVLALIAACSFSPSPATSTAPTQDGDIATQDDAAATEPHHDAMLAPQDGPKQHDAPPDACPDSDDDGICDDQDTWPCGAQPTAPPSTVTMTMNGDATKIVISNIVVDDKGQQIVAAPGTTVGVSFHYAITDTACSGNCDDQIEIGWIPGHRQSCPFDAAVSKSNGASGDITTTITLPSGSGEVDLRGNIGQNYSCNYNGANDWWNGAPGSNRTLGNVCVH